MVISLVDEAIRKLEYAIKYLEEPNDRHPNFTRESRVQLIEKHTTKIGKLTKIKEALGWNPEN